MTHEIKNGDLIIKINERFMNRKLIDLRSVLGERDNRLFGGWMETTISERDIDPTMIPLLDYIDVCELIRDYIRSYESLENLAKEDVPVVRCSVYGGLTEEVLKLYHHDLPTKMFLSQTIREFFEFLYCMEKNMNSKANWNELCLLYKSVCLSLEPLVPTKTTLVEALQQCQTCFLQPWIPYECSIEKFESNVMKGYKTVENILINSFAVVFPTRFTLQSLYNKQPADMG